MPVLYEDGTVIRWQVWSGRRGVSSADVWDTALWDEASWDGGTVVDFRQIPEERILSFTVDAGKDRFGRRFKASSVIMNVDNKDGLFTTERLLPGDYLQIDLIVEWDAFTDTVIPPGTMWGDVVGNTWQSSGNLILADSVAGGIQTFNMWYGRVDAATDRVRGGVDVTRIVAYDVFAELAAIDKDAQPSQGAGDPMLQRILLIASNASEAIGGVIGSGAPGEATMQATTLARNTLEEMQLTVESEGGDMWAHKAQDAQSKGVLEVRNRDWLTFDPKSVSVQWRFGPVGLPIVDAEISRDQQLIVNQASVSNAGGVQQDFQDLTSVQRFGPRTTRRLDLIAEDDTQAQFLAQRFVSNLRNIRPRVRNVTVITSDEATIRMGAEVAIGDLVLTTVASVNGWSFTFLAHVIGWTHEIFEDQWRVSLKLDDAFVDNVDGSYDDLEFSSAFRLGSIGG